MEFNGVKYSYAYNLQGDVVGIVDSTGNVVVQYSYDAWGKPIATTANSTLTTQLAELNPFRYRGYTWDQETELYYLQSRYYSAAIGRFISADIYVDNNAFSYSENNYINLFDESGELWQGEIHNAVQENICLLNPGITKEFRVTFMDTSKNGRVDLIRQTTGEYWEVKPAKYYLLGSTQLSRYVHCSLPCESNRAKLNGTPKRGGFIPRNTFLYKGYIVNYWYAGSGIILYDYHQVLNPVPKRSKAKADAPIVDEAWIPAPDKYEALEPATDTSSGVIFVVLVFAALIFAYPTSGASLALL